MNSTQDVIAFYPAMGIDIITPLVCIPNINKIIATGPLPHKQLGKGTLEKTINLICNLVIDGTNEVYEGKDIDEDDFIDFLLAEGEVTKRYNFKRKGLYLVQFKYDDRRITLYYYYNMTPEALTDKWPFKDNLTHVIHKGYKLNIYSDKNNFLKSLMPLISPATHLISDKSNPKRNMESF